MPALYVIRHAEPAVQGVLLGQFDPPLSAEGRKQAANLQIDPCIVYSSPLRRALETATAFCDHPVVLPELTEISYGVWNGLPWSEIESKWPRLTSRKLLSWHEITPPEGEPWEAFQTRILRALERVCSGILPAAIVAHEAVNAIIANQLAGICATTYRQAYCEIKTYDIPSNLQFSGESTAKT